MGRYLAAASGCLFALANVAHAAGEYDGQWSSSADGASIWLEVQDDQVQAFYYYGLHRCNQFEHYAQGWGGYRSAPIENGAFSGQFPSQDGQLPGTEMVFNAGADSYADPSFNHNGSRRVGN